MTNLSPTLAHIASAPRGVKLIDLLPQRGAHMRHSRLARKHSPAAIAARAGLPTPKVHSSKAAWRAAKAQAREGFLDSCKQLAEKRRADGPAKAKPAKTSPAQRVQASLREQREKSLGYR